jgi:SAM-dependent methyltransferase
MNKCTYCSAETVRILDLGFLPPVNVMNEVSEDISQITAFPLNLVFCEECNLTQISNTIDGNLIFPQTYPYLSGTTKILRDNFCEQAREILSFKPLSHSQLVVDIGSNDGTLLKNYIGNCKVLGIEPTGAFQVALSNGIDTIHGFFNKETAEEVLNNYGKASLVTACNVFAHIPDLKNLMMNIDSILEEDGIFISESHYQIGMLQTLQFDTIYHEHLRYYSANFLSKFLSDFGYEIIKIKEIPTHGGSIRVWAARSGKHKVEADVSAFLKSERSSQYFGLAAHLEFATQVNAWRHEFRKVIAEIRIANKSIYAIGAPSRASTLIAYSGLENSDLLGVGEVAGSNKIGRLMPGTRIPVISEDDVLSSYPDYLLILSWHIADELIPKLIEKGFVGQFIVPLPQINITTKS